jgi:predicted HAD superfamily hydrolase
MLSPLRSLHAQLPDTSNALVCSFDVFDTSLTRLIGRPTSLFYLLGQSLVDEHKWHGSAEAFAVARIASEKRARINTCSQEVTLNAIYSEMAHAYGLEVNAVPLFAGTELELEGRLLRPVPRVSEMISELRTNKRRIAFITDTYFPRKTIESWLKKFGLFADGDHIWASSEVGLAKHTGDLFHVVLERESIKSSSLKHFGDNALSDVAVPASLGIHTYQLDDCKLTRYEMIMEECASETCGVSSLFAGASRWVRLTFPAPTEDARKLRDLATQVAGPVLCAYVAWVLVKAKNIGLSRLLFTSRDGQVMLKVAERLKAKLGVAAELAYFYGGRQMLNLAGLSEVNAQAIEWITESAALLNLSDILKRVDLSASEVADEIDRYGLPQTGILDTSGIEILKSFLSDPSVVEKICRSAERRRRHIHGYLASCGLAESFSCGIVDIGWKGRVFHAIREVLQKPAGYMHTGLYFGLFAKPSNPQGLEAFLFDLAAAPPLGLGADIPSLASVMEIFCQANHGPVVDVIENESGYTPVLTAESNNANSRWDVAYFHRCVEAFVDALEITPQSFSNLDLRPMCERLLRTLMSHPSFEEASFLGAFNYNTDQGGLVAQPFAEPYRVSDFRNTFRNGLLPNKQHVWWLAGSIALTKPATLWLLRLACHLSKMRSTAYWRIPHRAFTRFRSLWHR